MPDCDGPLRSTLRSQVPADVGRTGGLSRPAPLPATHQYATPATTPAATSMLGKNDGPVLLNNPDTPAWPNAPMTAPAAPKNQTERIANHSLNQITAAAGNPVSRPMRRKTRSSENRSPTVPRARSPLESDAEAKTVHAKA